MRRFIDSETIAVRYLHDWSFARPIIALLSCALIACGSGCIEEKMTRTISKDEGWDVHPFADAKAMYTTPPTVGLDTLGREQLEKINDIVLMAAGSQHSTSADGWWMGLAYLNRHRSNHKVQQSLTTWAERCAADVKQSSGVPDSQAFSEANELYRQGNFGAASERYVQVLAKCPGHLDARNNLGLAQLHKGNDLIAQLQWEILRRVSDRYVPARINLTVVYERLGQRDKAKAIAQEAMTLQRESPIAVFNMAWLKDVEGDHQTAEALLRPFAELEISGRLTEFHQFVSQKASK